jgi:arylformamidase
MKIYDISQEVFGCRVYPGDPAPEKKVLASIEKGDPCNLSAFSMCAHNGTHVDAPFHFLSDGKTVDKIGLEAFVGPAFVAEHEGVVTGAEAAEMIEKARRLDTEAWRRILIKGAAVVSSEAAKVFAAAGILLLGNESQTVGPEEAPAEVHLILLGAGAVLLEGIRLAEVPGGVYLLCAAPLNLAGADGSPCRAVLIEGYGIHETHNISEVKEEMTTKKKGNNWTAYYDPDTGRYFAEIMYTSREGREQYDFEITQDIFARLGTFDKDYENDELIKTGKRTYSFENTMYGTLGPERLVWDEEANEAMAETVRKQEQKEQKTKKEPKEKKKRKK